MVCSFLNMAEVNRKRVIILGTFTASQYFLNSIIGIESDSDNEDDEELMKELINTEKNVRLRDKVRRAIRIEGYVEHIVPRFSGKQFKEHFRISPGVFDNLENRIGNLLLRQAAIGRATICVRKQLLSTLWLLATPDSYRYVFLSVIRFILIFYLFF